MIAILSCRAGGPTTASYARRISAADRIQQLLSNGRHRLIAPIPLVPYAVGLSLTVAYRCLRDHADVDPERVQADLATRCETLESLSTYWWTADAMARLGRKALKSLQQPGMPKHSLANIANAMDAEVSVCKFGPFEPRQPHATDSAKASADTTQATPNSAGRGHGTGNDGTAGNALHVLSDAAARHSTHPEQHDALASTTPGSGSFTASAAHSRSTNHTLNTAQGITSSSADTTTNSTSTGGFPATPHSRPASGAGGHAFGAPAAVGDALSSSFNDQYQYQFDDLDNLFDGFFDLSMPTIFQDPLFDGDAFLSAEDMNFAAAAEPDGMGTSAAGMGMGMPDFDAGNNSTHARPHASANAANMNMNVTATNTNTNINTNTSAAKPRGSSSMFPDILLN